MAAGSEGFLLFLGAGLRPWPTEAVSATPEASTLGLYIEDACRGFAGGALGRFGWWTWLKAFDLLFGTRKHRLGDMVKSSAPLSEAPEA